MYQLMYYLRRWAVALVFSALLFNSAHAEFPDVVARIKPSVVVVGTFDGLASPKFSLKGTGFVIGDGSLVATNAHVLDKAVESDNAVLTVVINPGTAATQMRRAVRLAQDEGHDLALLKIDGSPLPALTLADGGLVREGAAVGFTGFPIGGALGFSPVTHRGMISAVTSIAPPVPSARALNEKVIRAVKSGRYDVYQLDATAYPGNSGSPVFDAESGVVIGIINMVFIKSTREAALSQPSGISYAIPAIHLKELMAR